MDSLSLIVERKPSGYRHGIDDRSRVRGIRRLGKVEGVCNICRSFVGMAVCGRERGDVRERERTCVSISGRIGG